MGLHGFNQMGHGRPSFPVPIMDYLMKNVKESLSEQRIQEHRQPEAAKDERKAQASLFLILSQST
jgi:hypothetical protein